jgi:hypothetical protein
VPLVARTRRDNAPQRTRAAARSCSTRRLMNESISKSRESCRIHSEFMVKFAAPSRTQHKLHAAPRPRRLLRRRTERGHATAIYGEVEPGFSPASFFGACDAHARTGCALLVIRCLRPFPTRSLSRNVTGAIAAARGIRGPRGACALLPAHAYVRRHSAPDPMAHLTDIYTSKEHPYGRSKSMAWRS